MTAQNASRHTPGPCDACATAHATDRLIAARAALLEALRDLVAATYDPLQDLAATIPDEESGDAVNTALLRAESVRDLALAAIRLAEGEE